MELTVFEAWGLVVIVGGEDNKQDNLEDILHGD